MYGDMVRQVRRHRGLTQVQLAAIAGIEQPNISAIESGRRQPSAETLHRLLLACGFEVVAAAGPRVVPFPVPDEPAPSEPRREAATSIPMATRVRMLTAVLDASETIARSR